MNTIHIPVKLSRRELSKVNAYLNVIPLKTLGSLVRYLILNEVCENHILHEDKPLYIPKIVSRKEL